MLVWLTFYIYSTGKMLFQSTTNHTTRRYKYNEINSLSVTITVQMITTDRILFIRLHHFISNCMGCRPVFCMFQPQFYLNAAMHSKKLIFIIELSNVWICPHCRSIVRFQQKKNQIARTLAFLAWRENLARGFKPHIHHSKYLYQRVEHLPLC